MKAKSKVKRKTSKPASIVSVGLAKITIYVKRRRGLNRQGRDNKGRIRKPTFQFLDANKRQREFPTLEEAKREANRIATELSEGQAVAAKMTNAEAVSYGRAKVLLAPTGDSLETACERYAEAVKILGMGSKLEAAAKAYVDRDRLPVKFVSEVVDDMLAEKKGKVVERTLSDLRSRLERFAKDFHCPISSVATKDIQDWLDNLKTGPAKERKKAGPRNTINYRNKLSVLWNWALRRGFVLTNVVELTDRPRDNDNSAIEIYTPAELSRLLTAASKELLPCLAIGAFAGLRTGELMRLTWSDVNLTRGHIVASSKKVGTPSRRLVPIQSNLAQWLSPYANKKGLVWTGTEFDFHGAYRETAEATEIKTDVEKGIAAQEPVEKKDNALRHSFISYRLAILQNDSQVALEAGNSAGTIHGHYKELVTADDAKAWFSIAPEKPANVVPIADAQKA